MADITLQFFGGRGSSGGKRSGGGGASAASSKGKATESSNREILASIAKASASGNINEAAPKIEKVLKEAPVGTKFSVDAYYSKEGLMQSSFEKTSSSSWEMSWGTDSGKTYWKNKLTNRAAAADMFNAFNK